MKKRVGVVTNDGILYNKIRLLLRDMAEVSLLDATSQPVGFDLIFSDERYFSPEYECVRIGKEIPIPFRHEEIFSALEKARDTNREALVMLGDGKHAYLCGEKIKLTEVEYKLLDRLLISCPEFVSRDELLESVWGGECDTGVVNVYIHYLRQKLERGGNKVIISSRSFGYKIDEKYGRKGEKNA